MQEKLDDILSCHNAFVTILRSLAFFFSAGLSPQGHCQTFLDAMAMASVAHKPGNINAFTPDIRQRTFGCLSGGTLIMLGDVWRLWTKGDIDHENA